MGLACFGKCKDVVPYALFVSEKLHNKEQKRAKSLHLREALNVNAKRRGYHAMTRLIYSGNNRNSISVSTWHQPLSTQQVNHI